jgi:hypothetical protein
MALAGYFESKTLIERVRLRKWRFQIAAGAVAVSLPQDWSKQFRSNAHRVHPWIHPDKAQVPMGTRRVKLPSRRESFEDASSLAREEGANLPFGDQALEPLVVCRKSGVWRAPCGDANDAPLVESHVNMAKTPSRVDHVPEKRAIGELPATRIIEKKGEDGVLPESTRQNGDCLPVTFFLQERYHDSRIVDFRARLRHFSPVFS